MLVTERGPNSLMEGSALNCYIIQHMHKISSNICSSFVCQDLILQYNKTFSQFSVVFHFVIRLQRIMIVSLTDSLLKMTAQSCVHFYIKYHVCFRARVYNYWSLIPLQNRSVSIGPVHVQFFQASSSRTYYAWIKETF